MRVVDEPLYGHYLVYSGAEHPGRQTVIDAMDCDGDTVMRDLLQRQSEDPSRRLFLKHMAHHLIGLDTGFLTSTDNVLLVRNPREMLPSLTVQLPQATLADTGLQQQWNLYRALSDGGQSPAVVDSRDLLLNPESVLRRLCGHLDLEFRQGMLSWEAGPRPEDGIWAPHWYHAVHRSTGFAPYIAKSGFPERLQGLLDECMPYYEKLIQHVISADRSGETE